MEDNQQRSLAMANRSYYEKLGMVHSLEERRTEITDHLTAELEHITDPAIMELYDNYYKGVVVDISDSTRQVEDVAVIVQMEREKLTEATKKKRILELHRDQLEERYTTEVNRKERIEADDINLMRYKPEKRNSA